MKYKIGLITTISEYLTKITISLIRGRKEAEEKLLFIT